MEQLPNLSNLGLVPTQIKFTWPKRKDSKPTKKVVAKEEARRRTLESLDEHVYNTSYFIERLDDRYRGWRAVLIAMTETTVDPISGTVLPLSVKPTKKTKAALDADKNYVDSTKLPRRNPVSHFFKHFKTVYEGVIDHQRRNGYEYCAKKAWETMAKGYYYKTDPNYEDWGNFQLALQLCAGADFSFDPFRLDDQIKWVEMFEEYFSLVCGPSTRNAELVTTPEE